MIQPKYNPKEALEKMKLNMKYDTSKTLNENKEMINEALPALALWGIWVGTPLAIAGISTWISSITGGGDAIEKTKRLLEGCSTVQKGLKPTLDDATIDKLARDIYDGVTEKTGGIFFSTDEDKVKSAFDAMPTVADICAVKLQYEAKFSGDLFDDLDSDFDGEEFRKYIWLPIMDVIEKTNKAIKQVEKDPKKEDDKKDDGKKKTGGEGYTPCTGTYNFGCKSNEIAKVQACLGLVADGKFGPKTKAALSGKGFTSFTDSDVDKICNKTVEVDTDIEDVDAEDPNQL